MDKKKRLKELVEILNKAAKSYYVDAVEIMPNIEYDKLYDELLELEKETNVVLSNSPTQNVGYEIAGELPKKDHERLKVWKILENGLVIIKHYSHGRWTDLL